MPPISTMKTMSPEMIQLMDSSGTMPNIIE